ncbi:MAG: HPr family phosphocarrier protein [Kiritimatiellaceae bacterium]|nr:HPr family phosphocarrier protein [Kiritimatiellaceae bacterium]
MAEKKTINREFKVLNAYGLHARPAALIVKAAGKYSSDIFIGKKGLEVSAKSIMGLLTMEGHQGSMINVRIVGVDAEEALAEIQELFEKKFFEE